MVNPLTMIYLLKRPSSYRVVKTAFWLYKRIS